MRILAIAVAMAVTAACGGGDGDGGISDPPPPPSAPLAVSVTTGSNPPPRFIPEIATVAVGGTVTFENGSVASLPAPHDVISNTNAWPATEIGFGEKFDVTFTQAGTFPYHCSIHSGMTGTIIVE